MPPSNAYILGASDRSLYWTEEELSLMRELETTNNYALPGDTPEERLAALMKLNAHVNLLSNFERTILGLPLGCLRIS